MSNSQINARTALMKKGMALTQTAREFVFDLDSDKQLSDWQTAYLEALCAEHLDKGERAALNPRKDRRRRAYRMIG